MQKLEEMLINRKIAAPPVSHSLPYGVEGRKDPWPCFVMTSYIILSQGSYTKRLFDDPGLLQMKLLEEVQELVEATDPGEYAIILVNS